MLRIRTSACEKEKGRPKRLSELISFKVQQPSKLALASAPPVESAKAKAKKVKDGTVPNILAAAAAKKDLKHLYA